MRVIRLSGALTKVSEQHQRIVTPSGVDYWIRVEEFDLDDLAAGFDGHELMEGEASLLNCVPLFPEREKPILKVVK